MKVLSKLLILPVVIGLWGVSPAESRVCFIVGQNGACNNGGVSNFKPDQCGSDYKYTASYCTDNNMLPDGNACGGKYKGCRCDTSYYKYLVDGVELDAMESGNAKYVGKGKSCTQGEGISAKVYFERKVCKQKYKYTNIKNTTDLNNARLALGTVYHNTLTECYATAQGGGDSCEDKYDLVSGVSVPSTGVTKYTQCVCDSKYKYIKNKLETAFTIDDGRATACMTSNVDENDNVLKYDAIMCSGAGEQTGYWKNSCSDTERLLKTTSKDGYTCSLCAINTCAGVKTGYMSKEECKTKLSLWKNHCKQVDAPGTTLTCYTLEIGGYCAPSVCSNVNKAYMDRAECISKLELGTKHCEAIVINSTQTCYALKSGGYCTQ